MYHDLRLNTFPLCQEIESPDITGGTNETHIRNNVGSANRGWGAVVFGDNRYAYTGSYQETTGTGWWNFYASRSSVVYGAQNTVQPLSIQILIIVKT